MYRIELVNGLQWRPAVVETHYLKPTVHIAEVERVALAQLKDAQSKPNRLRPSSYRVLDNLGNCVKAGA